MTSTDSAAAARLAARIAEERLGPRLPPLLEAMRPAQWSKNVFVLAGIVFAGRWIAYSLS